MLKKMLIAISKPYITAVNGDKRAIRFYQDIEKKYAERFLELISIKESIFTNVMWISYIN